jgi:hypothetical protein
MVENASKIVKFEMEEEDDNNDNPIIYFGTN